jgi:hypothetical protein
MRVFIDGDVRHGFPPNTIARKQSANNLLSDLDDALRRHGIMASVEWGDNSPGVPLKVRVKDVKSPKVQKVFDSVLSEPTWVFYTTD